jgi:hypothetical protein
MESTALRDSIRFYMNTLDFPTDAKRDLLADFDRIAACPAQFSQLFRIASDYEADCHIHFTPLHAKIEDICAATRVHPYAGKMLLYLCLADALRGHYRARGISEQLFWHALRDLSYKLEECRLVHGVNGSFTGMWFSGFFKMERFALGRLQFELTNLKSSYTYNGVTLPEGQLAINIHIPRTGTRLDHGEVLGAYRLAKDFFAENFEGVPTVFTCHSWLLDPWNLTVLRPDANLAAFIRDFEIVAVEQCPDYTQLWRLFDCLWTGDPDTLPADSSLRRAYIERVKRGEKTAVGLGIFLMN